MNTPIRRRNAIVTSLAAVAWVVGFRPRPARAISTAATFDPSAVFYVRLQVSSGDDATMGSDILTMFGLPVPCLKPATWHYNVFDGDTLLATDVPLSTPRMFGLSCLPAEHGLVYFANGCRATPVLVHAYEQFAAR